MSKYTIGLDYGTLSVRGIILNLETGIECAASIYPYSHQVMSDSLSNGTALAPDWALQHPSDYLDGFYFVVQQLLEVTAISAEEILSIGIDFTSCTILPTTSNGIPLCVLPEFSTQPHAYAKLWKHHAAQYCADRLNTALENRNDPHLPIYGGKISCEWMIPKAMQILSEAPALYHASHYLIEAGDWLTWQLSGRLSRSVCQAGFKSMWHHKLGYPPAHVLHEVQDGLETLLDKIEGDILPLGKAVGNLTQDVATKTGLSQATLVATAVIDAHAALPACGICRSGDFLAVIGTSTCHLILSDEEQMVAGACGVVKDGIIPSLYAYESGQSSVGDGFAWFIETCVPESLQCEARRNNMDINRFLTEKASALHPGESGVIALDWLNGARSPFMNFNLSGLLLGHTIATKPEEIYRALIEATAYGTRRIIETYQSSGIPIKRFFAAGGIASKNEMAMQIYADVCNQTVYLTDSEQAGARGAAIYAAHALNLESMDSLVSRLGAPINRIYTPKSENVAVYEELYQIYRDLSEAFANQNKSMVTLKSLRNQQKEIKSGLPESELTQKSETNSSN